MRGVIFDTSTEDVFDLGPQRLPTRCTVSLEMSAEQIAYREIASLSGVSVKKQISGEFDQKEFLDIGRRRNSLSRSRSGSKTDQANRQRAPKGEAPVWPEAVLHRSLEAVEPEQEHWNVVRTSEPALVTALAESGS
ncbi:hypothetical protein ACQPTN_05140 [Bradyrhizobium sp. 13971]